MFLASNAFEGQEEIDQICVFQNHLAALGQWIRRGKNASVAGRKRVGVPGVDRKPQKMGQGR